MSTLKNHRERNRFMRDDPEMRYHDNLKKLYISLVGNEFMTKIDFNEPSTGNVNSDDDVPALQINQSGAGGGIVVTNKKRIGILVDTGDPFQSGADASGVYITVKGPGATGIKVSSDKGEAITASSLHSHAVHASGGGEEGYAAVYGQNGNGTGVLGQSDSKVGILGKGPIAGRFEGDVEITGKIRGDISVTGDIKLLNPQNADCAEDFDILDGNVEPGTVMVLTENGSLQSSHQEYDKKVAGIISGAGGYSPALVLNRQDQSRKENQNENNEDKNKSRLPIALMGKVYCKVDARDAPIEIGDLLTTSSTKGYAMKAEDPMKAFGAVIGKALGSIKEGLGMIPVLVALQ